MFKKNLLLGATVLSASLISAPAFAQSGDEIIVTATKRATTLQDTPISVSVTSSEVIEQAQILDILSLQSVVPAFRVSQLQNSANTSLAIRGFGNGGNNLGIEPAVGLFIDGVYRSRAGAQIADLPALERVEVLAGPQSTLFGKNASVGVVSIVTEAPQFVTQGYVEGGYGNFDSSFGRAYLTGALSDTVAVSVGGGFQNRDGVFNDAEGTSGSDLNDRSRFNLRGQVLWEPTDNLSLRVIVDRSEIDENCCGTTTAIVGPTSALVAALGGQLASVEPGQALGPNENAFTQETALNGPTQNEIDDTGISAQVDYDFKNLTFTSITALRSNESSFDSDSDFTTLEILDNVFQVADIETFTQELRVSSNYDGRFNWQLGATYFDESLDVDSGIDFGDDARPFLDALATSGASIVDPTASPLIGIELVTGNPVGTFFSADTSTVEAFTQDNESYSIFGTIDFDVTDKFTVTVGGNYTDDQKDVTFSQVNSDAFSNLTLQGDDGLALLFANGVPAGFAPFIDLTQLDLTNVDEDTGVITPLVGGALTSAFEAFFGANPGALDPNLVGAPQAVIDGTIAGTRDAVEAGLAGFSDTLGNPVTGILALQNTPQALGFPNAVEDGSSSDDDFTWSVRGSYELNDNFTGYASAATGFKASSFNLTRDTAPFLADAAALGAAGLLNQNTIPETGRGFGTRFAEAEEITTFEVGIKTRFERGALNVAVFDQSVENFQSTIFNGTGFVLANAGEQSTQGIEFDGTFDVAEWLTVTAAGVIQDPVYDEFTGAAVQTGSELDIADGVIDGVGDLSGEQPAGINEVSLSTSATFKYEFENGIQAFLRGDYQYEDDVQLVDNILGVNRSTNIFNGALGFNLDNGVGIRFWARNITDDRSFTSAFPGVIQAGTVNAYPNEPRTYGVSLRYNFSAE